MKATQSEIKQNIQGTNSNRKETRTQINNLEQKEEINIQLEQNEETRIPKNEESLRKLWDNFKCYNIWLIGVPEGEQQQETENLLEQIMKENFPNLFPGKGNRLPGSPGSPVSPKKVGPKQEHTKAYHNYIRQDQR